MEHSINDHLTPELLEELKKRDEESFIKRTDKILNHINEESDDPELMYAKGIAYYYLGEYEKCMEIEELCYPCFGDEMGIAAMFWDTLAAFRCGKEPKLLNDHYKCGMLVGHHKSYNKICALVKGTLSLENAMLMFSKEFRALDYSIFGYGLYCYLDHIGEKDRAKEILHKVYENKDFWITYAWLAARIDILNGR